MGSSRREPLFLYSPLASPKDKRRGMGCYVSMLFLGVVMCVILTIHPDGPQVIPWLMDHIGASTPAQAARVRPALGVVNGTPSLSPTFLDQVLAKAHSPAQGTGQALYNLSERYQVDDAYALAFFKAESQYGTTGQARVTLSLGNIRCAGYARCINGYRAYSSYQQGYQDWYQLIRNLYINTWHLTTVDQIIPVYAPANDGNNPAAYIAMVKRVVPLWWNGHPNP